MRNPKYTIIKEKIKEEIYQEVYPRGSRLPPDSELYKKYQANRLTVIRALQTLEQEGFIERRAGSGTFVNRIVPPKDSYQKLTKIALLWATNFSRRTLRSHSYYGVFTQGVLDRFGIRIEHIQTYEIDKDTQKGTWKNIPNRLELDCLGEPKDVIIGKPRFDWLANSNYDGFITVGISEDEYLNKIAKLGKPLIIADHPGGEFIEGADIVYADPINSYLNALRYLRDKGYKRIFFLGTDVWVKEEEKELSISEWRKSERERMHDADSLLRLHAYQQAMNRLQLEVTTDMIHWAMHSNRSLSAKAAELKSLPPQRQPDAIIAHSVNQAEKIRDLLEPMGIFIECVGSGQSDRSHTIELNLHEMGYVAAEVIMNRLNTPFKSPIKVGVNMVFDTTQKS